MVKLQGLRLEPRLGDFRDKSQVTESFTPTNHGRQKVSVVSQFREPHVRSQDLGKPHSPKTHHDLQEDSSPRKNMTKDDPVVLCLVRILFVTFNPIIMDVENG